MYHAAAKTELARSFTQAEATANAYGFYQLTRSLLDWNPDNLRLRSGGIFSRKDAVRTSFASRFGEAMLHLFMVQNGYAYWDHIPSLAERALNKAEIRHDEQVRVARAIAARLRRAGRPDKEPDFAFEKPDRQVALAEAKGGFVQPDSPPSTVKGDLSHALDQLGAWIDFVLPRPRKCFAVGTYLRERGDHFSDPSLLAFVDPEPHDTTPLEQVPFADDWIRRGNYGSWLIGMGLSDAGHALRAGQTVELPPRELPILSLGGRLFACVFAHQLLWTPLLPRLRALGAFHADVHVIGLELQNMRRIENAVHAPDATLLEDMSMADFVDVSTPNWFSGSIMPDGSLYGLVHLDQMDFPFSDFDRFKL